MQCPVCHKDADPNSAFCNHCGASLSAAAPAAAAAPSAGYPATPAATSSGLTPNAAAALSYVTVIPAILFLLIEPYNKQPLVRFHSFQSIGLAVVWFALCVVVAVLSAILAFIPFLRVIIFIVPFLYPLVGLCFFVLWLVCLIKASKGEWFKLPIIGDFAMKQAKS